jgi:hypothetical protein
MVPKHSLIRRNTSKKKMFEGYPRVSKVLPLLSPDGEVQAYLVPREKWQRMVHMLHVLQMVQERKNDTWIPLSEIEKNLKNEGKL